MTDKKKEKPFVFVRCLTYNHEKYIEDALKGFVMQKTDFPFLAVVIDDCSTDGTADIVRRYEAQYPDIIKGIYLPHNFHQTKEDKRPYYQKYIDKATYWAECEGDDYWTDPYKLQKQVDFMETHPEYGVCYTDYDYLEEANGEYIDSMYEKRKNYRPKSYEEHLVSPGYLAPMTWLLRKDLWHNPIEGCTDSSYAMMLMWLKNNQVAYMPFVSATYRSHIGSASYPINVEALYRYSIGVFEVQKYFVNNYPCSSELKAKVYMHGYLDKLPIAIMANQEEFVEEARTFMRSQELDIDLIIRELKQGEMRKQSKAYRLGKTILRPYKWLKEIMAK